MNSLYYEIREIPDLSLAKYQSLGEMGVEGVLTKHASFLRQWQRIASICNLGIHLYISFEPTNTEGERIRVYLAFSFEREELREKLCRMMEVSPLSDYFGFTESENIERKVEKWHFNCKSYVKKQEHKKVTEDESHLNLFTVESWKPNEDARLYDLFRSMCALGERAVYAVTLYGEDAYYIANQALSKPIAVLRKRMFGKDNHINLKNESKMGIRDIATEETLKCYEEFLEVVANSPCFHAEIRVLADSELTSQILLNAACSEAIAEGNCKILSEKGDFSVVLNEKSLVSELVPESLKFWPTLYSLEEIAPFFRFPTLYDGEYIEIKKETMPVHKKEGLLIGTTTQKNTVSISLASLMKHAFVCGVPGAGKTNTMLHLAYSLWKSKERKFDEIIERSIPFLVFEPAKREYRELALFDIPELIVFSPNANTRFPLQLNPFEFPKGLTLSEHITRLRQVFEGAFPIQAPAPFILDQSIEAVYRKLGWHNDDINIGDKEYPIMSELYEEFQKQIQNTSYDSEIQGNIRSVLEMRIGSLIRREKKDIFDVRRSIITPEEWLKKPIVLELEALGKETANFVTLLICTLIRETLKVYPMEGIEKRKVVENGIEKTETWKPLRHVIFIEEAHNLIASQTQMESNQESNPKIAATECIVDILKEVRALREGVIIADQLPTAMATDVIKNTNIKLVHRLTSGDDRAMVGSTMAANDLQMEQVATYLPGQALMTYEGLLRPFQIQVVNLENHGSETPDDMQLYEIMKDKPGQKDIYRRIECRKWMNLEKKIKTALSLEKMHCEALHKYDFTARTPEQTEDFFEQCAVKLQALQLMKQNYYNECKKMPFEFLGKENADIVLKTVKMLGNTYQQEVQKLVRMYVQI